MQHTVTILPANKILFAKDGAPLLSLLRDNGFFVPAACGGNGSCGKCKVKLLSGSVTGTSPDADGLVLSCRARIASDLVIEYSQKSATESPAASPIRTSQSLGAVLDIGTTTLALRVCDLANRNTFTEAAALNPQAAYGADVLSRINAFSKGEGGALQQLILNKTNSMLEELAGKGTRLQRMIVAANPTMLHLFLGIDPTPIGTYPFTPAFHSTQRLSGDALGLPVDEVILLPFAHAYVGGDVTAGVLFCNMQDAEESALLLDIGTNGEMVLSHHNRLICASAAAGPALEGASIECGIGGVAGAISHVQLKKGALRLETVGGVAPTGICGSGLVDLIAILVSEGMIDEGGTWDNECESALAAHLVADRFYLCDGIYLSQADIRQFQLAKAAISAGIKSLLKESGASLNEIGKVYIAGGMGFYIDPESARITGLLPHFENASITAVGNTSLLGGELCLDPLALSKAEDTASKMKHLELSFSEEFRNTYIEDMGF